jgi:CRISPR-associated protein Cmr4
MSEPLKIVSRPLVIFTRTPLHVGAGSSVGAIDQPIQRERHTGFPIIPASSLKGTFSDCWNDRKDDGKLSRTADGNWLFGVGSDTEAAAGAIQLAEARLLAFPIRSAKGSYAWVTCPLMLRRAVRDGLLPVDLVADLKEPVDEEALFAAGNSSKLDLAGEVVLEEYTFRHAGEITTGLGTALAGLLEDEVWREVDSRLVILSNGMMSYFAQNACDVAQHVRIDDETGTAASGALFNQENVPGETLFYSVVTALEERSAKKDATERRPANVALDAFGQQLAVCPVYQFGGDASTGLGYCTVKFSEVNGN